jgi:hypothetical protein
MTAISCASSPQHSTMKLEWQKQSVSERTEYIQKLLLGNKVTYEHVACTKF